jgi:hypothetical protein
MISLPTCRRQAGLIDDEDFESYALNDVFLLLKLHDHLKESDNYDQ